MKLRTSIHRWTQFEQVHGALGVFPSHSNGKGNAKGADFFLARYKNWNAKQAEELTRTLHLDPLLKLRALISLGKLAEADELLNQLNTSTPDKASEVLIERARLCAFSGDWEGAVVWIEKALQGPLFPLSRLTCHQIRALALFELGQFGAASLDLDWVDSIRTVFPKALPVLYSKILRIKIVARDRSPQVARAQLDALWLDMKEAGEINMDSVLSLLRLEIDLRREEGRAHGDIAIASYLLSKTMGDELYSALGLFDASFSELKLSGSLREEMANHVARYVRLQKLESEITQQSAKSTPSTTARNIIRFDQLNFGSKKTDLSEVSEIGTIVLLSRELAVDFKNRSIQDLSSTPQLLRALQAFLENAPLQSSSQMDRKKFFSELWKRSAYRPTLHDNPINLLLHRLRKDVGVDITGTKAEIQLRKCWICA